MRTLYPALADVAIDAEWSGSVDRSVTGLPVFGGCRATAGSCTGSAFRGTASALPLGGHVLASLAVAADDGSTGCRLVFDRHDRFPVEPVRLAGSLAVRAAVARKERRTTPAAARSVSR